MFQFLILSVLFRTAFSQSECPSDLARAYQQGYRKAAAINTDFEHIDANDIGNVFFAQPPYPLEAYDDFNRTIACVFSEQIYSFGNPKDKSTVLRNKLKQYSECVPLNERCSTMPIEKCPKDQRYRSVTGACNNVKNPKWGKSFTPYGRIQPAFFADSVYDIRKSVINKVDLPGARLVTNKAIKRDPFTCDPKFHANHGAVMFGQLMAHDHGMRQMMQTKEGGFTRSCCSKDYTKPLSPQPFGCHAFEYTKDDPFLSEVAPKCNVRCMNYIRSQLIFPNDCNLAPAAAVNMVSHYVDLSPVYGIDEETYKQLRSFTNGQLKNNNNKVLPETCNDTNTECYLTGDFRGGAFFTLGVLQSMYHRFHNIVADNLKKINPKWNDEQLFQEARRIVIAVYQNNIIEWLVVFVGEEETKKFQPVNNNYVGKYQPNVDASSTAEFSHCVFRVYHSNLPDKFHLINANDEIIRTMDIDECDVGLKILETNYDDVVRGMLRIPSAHSTYSAKIRNQMFNNGNKHNLGVDLISTDLFIGRDLGIAPYYIYFELCTGIRVESWDDLKLTIPAKSVADLQSVYKHFLDVDTYAAVALEKKCGSYLGRVGKCLMVKQYERTIQGDRYFYSLPNGAYPFTPSQLKTIYNFKYADLVCAVTNISEVPSRAFEITSNSNPMVKCNGGGIDLSAWKVR